mgnify:CR=1 FL=1
MPLAVAIGRGPRQLTHLLGEGGDLFGVDYASTGCGNCHVETCDQCQDFLAELWDGGLDHDLVEPVVTMIRLELFLMEAAKLGGGMVADMLKAFVTYLDPGLGKDDQ